MSDEQILMQYFGLRLNNPDGDAVLSKQDFETNIVDSIKKYMEKNINEKITINDICKYLNYGKSTAYKIFKKHTNQSIIDFFLELKFDKAKELLTETSMSVTQISDSLAFSSPAYFSRLFKIKTNVSPSYFREHNKRI